MLLEEPHGPKRLQEADQRRRVGVAVRSPVGRPPLTSRLIHLPLPYGFWETILISYCAAIVVRIRAPAQGVVYRSALLMPGQGAVVAVVGEAGLGKSRLIAEVRKLVNTDPQHQVVWLEGRAISYRQTMIYYPWQQVVRQAIGVS